MSEIRIQLLAYVIRESAKNITPANPNGYCYVMKEQESGAQELAAAGLIEAQFNSRNAEGAFPVRPTDTGLSVAQQPQAQPQPGPVQMQTAPVAAVAHQHHHDVTIETGIPMPAANRRGGFQPSENGTKLDRYKFAHMPIGGSFFVPQSESTKHDVPVHRNFSSVVSQANAKLHPMQFSIREVDETSQGNGKGARVWRIEDAVGPRPARKPRKPKHEPEAQQAASAPGGYYNASQTAGGFAPAPQGGGFGQDQGFGGFPTGPAPAPASAPFGGGFGSAGSGFPENMPSEAPPFTGGFGGTGFDPA